VEAAMVEQQSRARHRSGEETRSQIQEIALELFAEQGYDKTSLREIADRLGVTKAALYYHFKSKEEIVAATVEDFLADIDSLVAWGEQQPRTEEMRQEVLRRYAAIVRRRYASMRFFHQNPAGTHQTGLGGTFKQRMGDVYALLVDEGDVPPAQKIRALLAVMSLNAGGVVFADDESSTPDERSQAALDVAFELVHGGVDR
jgi:AcrR family transcriptional regulator